MAGCTALDLRTQEVRSVSRWVLAAALVALVGCSSGPQTTRIAVTIPEDALSAEAVFTALDPREHQQVIVMEVTPVDEVISLTFAADRDLGVGTSGGCPVEQESARCEMRLPILEARKPGEWTAVVRRDNPGPSVDVSIHIEWLPVQDRA